MDNLRYDADGFRRVVPDTKGYRGLTALRLDGQREVVVCGTGREAEAVLRAWVEGRR